MKLIVGLGNPEKQYAKTRHNLGFEVLDEYRRKKNLDEWQLENKFKAEIIKVGPDLILVRPQTYMNNSGLSVRQLVDYFKVKPEDIIVVYDELDLPFGKIKIRMGGAAAGHHGVESIMSSIGTDRFIRIRLGIGTPETQSAEHGGQHVDVNHFVLSSFNHNEKSHVKHMLKQVIHALDALLEEGLEVVQNQYN